MGLVVEVIGLSPAPTASGGMDPGHPRVCSSGGLRDIVLVVAASGTSWYPLVVSPQIRQRYPTGLEVNGLSGPLTYYSVLVFLVTLRPGRMWGQPSLQVELARETGKAAELPHGARPRRESTRSAARPQREQGHSL